MTATTVNGYEMADARLTNYVDVHNLSCWVRRCTIIGLATALMHHTSKTHYHMRCACICVLVSFDFVNWPCALSIASTNTSVSARTSGGDKPCTCPKILKPVCGKDGKTYPNECLAKCAKVAVKENKPCSQNMEAAKVWMAFVKGNSKWVSDFQKGWKTGNSKPVTATKKTMGTTKTAYTFKFSNGCAVTVVYDISKNSAKRESSKCSTGKCVDDISTLSKYLAQLKLPKTRFVAVSHLVHTYLPDIYIYICILYIFFIT